MKAISIITIHAQLKTLKKYLNGCSADLEHICTPLKTLYDKLYGGEKDESCCGQAIQKATL
ncbi:hypothetical protein [Clostridium thermosuccinogenes]|uniref:hypothetical protein n=1 Tax=Clostridium thermosuccinogenes TaxID=84032 RepID=UPI0013748239|nr:hypothetical protein [Pseudoclostridium thermosuccinogenes]